MFQDSINDQPAVAVRGDFADANVRATVLAGPGAMVAAPPPRSPIVGHFAWGNQVDGQAFSRYQGETVAKIGFVHRENQTIITDFLDESAMLIDSGLPVTLFNQGSFWAEFIAGSAVGDKVFANYLDGSVYSAPAGTSTVVASAMTGDIDGGSLLGVLTVSAITGALNVGNVLTGGLISEPVAIVSQISGTPTGIGTYLTTATVGVANLTDVVGSDSVETDFFVDSAALIDASITAELADTGVLTVSAVGAGVIDVGQSLSGVGVPLGAKIIGFGTGSGGVGTYNTNQRGLVLTSRDMLASNGQLAKISTWS